MRSQSLVGQRYNGFNKTDVFNHGLFALNIKKRATHKAVCLTAGVPERSVGHALTV